MSADVVMAGALVIEAALRLDQAEAVWDNPNHTFHHAACWDYEKAKGHFRQVVAEYRKVAHGEPVTTHQEVRSGGVDRVARDS